jgi:hypothetical protein
MSTDYTQLTEADAAKLAQSTTDPTERIELLDALIAIHDQRAEVEQRAREDEARRDVIARWESLYTKLREIAGDLASYITPPEVWPQNMPDSTCSTTIKIAGLAPIRIIADYQYQQRTWEPANLPFKVPRAWLEDNGDFDDDAAVEWIWGDSYVIRCIDQFMALLDARVQFHRFEELDKRAQQVNAKKAEERAQRKAEAEAKQAEDDRRRAKEDKPKPADGIPATPAQPNYTDGSTINDFYDHLYSTRSQLHAAIQTEATARETWRSEMFNAIKDGRVQGKNEEAREMAAREVLADQYQALQQAQFLAAVARLEYDLAAIQVRRIQTLQGADRQEF